jgi:hypothetical protein
MGYMAHTADTSTEVDVAEESDLKVRMHGTVAVVTGAYREIVFPRASAMNIATA